MKGELEGLSFVSWTVRLVGEDEDAELSVYVIGLAEREDGQGQQLLFQLPLELDTTDDPEDSTYCLTNEVGCAAYGGVLKWDVNDEYLTLTLDREVAKVLQMETENRFALQVPPEQVELLRQGLHKVFSLGLPS